MAANLQRLSVFLDGQPSMLRELFVTFARVADVIGGPLPAAATASVGWWQRNRQASAALREAGWRASGISAGLRGVRLVRRASGR